MRNLNLNELNAFKNPQHLYPIHTIIPFTIEGKNYHTYSEASFYHSSNDIVKAQSYNTYILRLIKMWYIHYDPIIINYLRNDIVPILFDHRSNDNDEFSAIIKDNELKLDNIKNFNT